MFLISVLLLDSTELKLLLVLQSFRYIDAWHATIINIRESFLKGKAQYS